MVWYATGSALALMAAIALSHPVPSGTASSTPRTYYVDPQTGSNDNDGLSPQTPWRNPPGTRTADDRNFYSHRWGAVTAARNVQCGDTILLKGGAVQTRDQGGAWRIDDGLNEHGDGFYATHCPEHAPITIRVATASEWPGSSGGFALDGRGISATCLATCGDTHGLIHIQDVDTLTLAGSGAPARLIVRHAAGSGWQTHNVLVTASRSPGAKTERFMGRWLELSHAQSTGIGIGPAEQFVVEHTTSHHNGASGFSTGNMNDNPVVGGAFEDVEAYANGQHAVSGIGDEFLFLGCRSCYLIGGIAHDGNLRGLNFGNVTDFRGNDMFLLVRDSAFWNNGRTADDRGVWQGGVCWSGDDRPGGQVQRGILERVRIFRNREGGGPCAYGQGWAEAWNSVWWENGWDKSVGGAGDIAVAAGGDIEYLGVFNSIVQKSGSSISWTLSGPSGFNATRCPLSDYNLYIPAADNNELLADFDCYGSSALNYTGRTYAAPPKFMGGHDRIGSARSAYGSQFVSVPASAVTAGTFHLPASSSAIDAGTYLLRAASAGSGATITVAGNGASSDPRHYLISPESYYQARGDVVQIKNASCQGGKGAYGSAERARITSMSATTITLDRICSWQGGAGIHFPWSGAAPDMGVAEFSP